MIDLISSAIRFISVGVSFSKPKLCIFLTMESRERRRLGLSCAPRVFLEACLSFISLWLERSSLGGSLFLLTK